MSSNDSLHSIEDDEILLRLSALVRDVRRNEATLVAHLAEVDVRRLYARGSVPSLFAYCTEVLHFSEPEACLRITVARASRRYPMLLAMLEDGRIHLSGVAVLAPHLTAENSDALLSCAVHRSKRHLEELVAGIAPRADVPDRIRRLPEQKASRQTALLPGRPGERGALPRLDEVESAGRPGVQANEQLPPLAGTRSLAHGQGAAPTSATEAGVTARLDELESSAVGDTGQYGWTRSASPGSPRAGTVPGGVEPLSAGRYKVHFTASAALREKLERLQALMQAGRSVIGLASAIEAAVDEKLARLEARRFGRTDRPRKTAVESDATPRSRHIPAAIRRAVWKRDEGRCRFVDAEGQRCLARRGLEFHLVHPFGMGGQNRVDDLRLTAALTTATLPRSTTAAGAQQRGQVHAPRLRGCLRIRTPAVERVQPPSFDLRRPVAANHGYESQAATVDGHETTAGDDRATAGATADGGATGLR